MLYQGNESLVRALLAAGVDTAVLDPEGRTPFAVLCTRGDDASDDTECKFYHGLPSGDIYRSCRETHEMMDAFMARGADPFFAPEKEGGPSLFVRGCSPAAALHLISSERLPPSLRYAKQSD
jgi:hypothetical protein